MDFGPTPIHAAPLKEERANGRVYTKFDIALLKSMGVGSRPAKLKRTEEVLSVGG